MTGLLLGLGARDHERGPHDEPREPEEHEDLGGGEERQEDALADHGGSRGTRPAAAA